MSKIDNTVLKETKYIAVWVIVLSAVMEAVFLIIGMWDYKVLLGNIFGAAVAVLNFLLMGLTVQKAVTKEEKEAKALIKTSQSLRTLLLFVAVVAGILIPCFNGFGAVIPLFFPRIAVALVPLRDKKSSSQGGENQ